MLFGHGNGDQYSGLDGIIAYLPDVKISSLAEKQLESVFGAGQAETVGIAVAVENAGIQDHEFMEVLFEVRNDLHFTAVDLAADPVLDGVFHEGLQHHWRNGLVEGIFVDIEFDLEAVFEADMFEC
jgi:hypothetical protein